MGKFYAVKAGLVPGVYTTWDECKAQVEHFSGAVYKSFATEAEARAFVNGVPYIETGAKALEPLVDKDKHIDIWVDGSYNSDTNEYGYGVYLKGDGREMVFCGKKECIEGGRNIEGEVHAAEVALTTLVKLYPITDLPACTIYHDYEGVGKWADKEWRTNKSYTEAYAQLVNALRDQGLDITFSHVYGHSGVKGNEYVDKLAKIGCGIELTKAEKAVLMELKDVEGFPKELLSTPKEDIKPESPDKLFDQKDVLKLLDDISEWIYSDNRGSEDYFIVDKIEEIVAEFKKEHGLVACGLEEQGPDTDGITLE